MNVHVVSSDTSGNRILPRLARLLAQGNGWSLGAGPDPRADLNFFLIYIDYAESHPTFNATPTAAWFTHYEEGHPLKEQWWKQAARGVDLRLTSAAMYARMLEPYGPTRLVRPPIVDRERFGVKPRPGNAVPRVGLSGFVPRKRTQRVGSGPTRKGEHLVAKLERSELARRFKLMASGQGWPVRRQSTRQVEELAAFYQGLDLFLCTSTIEGVPMPPLEALACGVPVVIPREVGLLDELPAVPGIFRYERGSFEGLSRALARALDWLPEMTEGDRRGMAEAVATYTPANWCGDVKRALEGLLYDVDVHEEHKEGRRGVYYVAYGKPAREMAAKAMASFKAHVPGVPVALVGAEPLGGEDVFVEHEDVDIGGRCAKTKIYDLAPAEWEYVLYLDADTEVVADISFLYQLLADGWEFVICKNPQRFHVCVNMVRPDNQDECVETFKLMGSREILQLNGGVFGFRRNERTRAFFRAWHEEWNRWGKRDQAALLRALWKHPLRIYVLGNEWNTVTRYDPAERSAGILHYPQTARRWEGLIQGRADERAAWNKVRRFEAKGVRHR